MPLDRGILAQAFVAASRFHRGRFEGRSEGHSARLALRRRRSLASSEKPRFRGASAPSRAWQRRRDRCRLSPRRKQKSSPLVTRAGGVTKLPGIDPIKAIRYKERSGNQLSACPCASRHYQRRIANHEVRHSHPGGAGKFITLS